MQQSTQQQTLSSNNGGGGAFKTGRALQGIESEDQCLDSALLEMIELDALANDTTNDASGVTHDALPGLVNLDSSL